MSELDGLITRLTAVRQTTDPHTRAAAVAELREIVDIILGKVWREALVEATSAKPAAAVAEHLGLSPVDVECAVTRHQAATRRRYDSSHG